MFLQYVLKHRTTAATCTIGAIDAAAAAAVLVPLSTALLRTLADLFTRSLLTGMASATTCNIGEHKRIQHTIVFIYIVMW